MYGLVNVAIQELVVSTAGEAKWQEIKARAGINMEVFSRMQPYDDDVTYRLVGAASEVLGLPGAEVMRRFGEFWVLYTGRSGYGEMFTMAGSDMKAFLANLDNMHTRIGLNFPALQPPSFQVEDEPDGRVRLHYFSDRQGLCPMVFGLLDGLGQLFKTSVAIEHPICKLTDAEADHCEFLLVLQRHG